MSYRDMHIAKYEKMVTAPDVPEDFHSFWAQMVKRSEEKPITYTRKEVKTPYCLLDLYEIRYSAADDTEVVAWFQVPKNIPGKKPCIVRFHGGSGQKGISWTIVGAGMCCLMIDVRGQGGDTVDNGVYHSGGDYNHGMQSGILDKNEYYLGNVYLDAYRAVEVAAMQEEVDPERIGVSGGSQGGGMALVTAALNKRVKAADVHCPSYTCMHNRMENRSGVIGRITDYIFRHPEHLELIWDNVRYFDGLNHAPDITVPTFVGLTMDDKVCLPQFTYSAYKALNCEKEIRYYPYSPHSGPHYQMLDVMYFFQKYL